MKMPSLRDTALSALLLFTANSAMAQKGADAAVDSLGGPDNRVELKNEDRCWQWKLVNALHLNFSERKWDRMERLREEAVRDITRNTTNGVIMPAVGGLTVPLNKP
jgi:hypothetical protein